MAIMQSLCKKKAQEGRTTWAFTGDRKLRVTYTISYNSLIAIL